MMNTKEQQIRIRLSSSEKAQIKQMAKKEGMTMTQLIVKSVLDKEPDDNRIVNGTYRKQI